MSNRSRRAGTAFTLLFLLLPSYATLAYVVLPAFPRSTWTSSNGSSSPPAGRSSGLGSR